jgi:hypothetical protein
LLTDAFGEFTDEIEAATRTLEIACRKIATMVEDLIIEYRLSRDQVSLIGGGGGAASIVPFTAKLMGLEHRIARNAEVISPIGVAMAMVRDTIERNIVDPSPDDILRIRRAAADAAVVAGAVPDSVEVQVEVDKRRNLVRATAMGATELRKRDGEQVDLSVEQRRESAARSMRIDPSAARLEAESGNHLVFTGVLQVRSLFGLIRSRQHHLRVVDRAGVVRLQRGRALVSVTTSAQIKAELARMVEKLTDFGDAGRAIPDIFILYGARIANFSGLPDLNQVAALAEIELRSVDPEAKMIIIACPKHG